MKTDLIKVCRDLTLYAKETGYDGTDVYDLLNNFKRSQVFMEYRPKYKKIVNGLRGKKSWSVEGALLNEEELKRFMDEGFDDKASANKEQFEMMIFSFNGKNLIVPVAKEKSLMVFSYQIICILLGELLSGTLISDSYEYLNMYKVYLKMLQRAYTDNEQQRMIACKVLLQRLETSVEITFKIILLNLLIKNDTSKENCAKYTAELDCYREFRFNDSFKILSYDEVIDKGIEQLKSQQEKYIEYSAGKTDNYRAVSSLNAYTDAITRILIKKSGVNADSYTQGITYGAEDAFPEQIKSFFSRETWRNIHKYGQHNLIAAELILSYMGQSREDYSLPCLCLCRAVETELKQRFIYPYIDNYERVIKNGRIKVDNRVSNKYYLYDFAGRIRRANGDIEKSQYTLALFAEMTGYFSLNESRYNAQETEWRRKDWKSFVVVAAEFLHKFSAEEMEKRLLDVIPEIIILNDEYRRVASHPNNYISYDNVLECRNSVCNADGILNRLLSE